MSDEQNQRERSDLRKIGTKDINYVIECLGAGQIYPEIMPKNINIASLEIGL